MKNGRKACSLPFERMNGFDQGIHRLLAEENAGGMLREESGIRIKTVYGFADTTAAVCNYRTAEGKRLDGDNSKVLFTREQQGAAMGVLLV